MNSERSFLDFTAQKYHILTWLLFFERKKVVNLLSPSEEKQSKGGRNIYSAEALQRAQEANLKILECPVCLDTMRKKIFQVDIA